MLKSRRLVSVAFPPIGYTKRAAELLRPSPIPKGPALQRAPAPVVVGAFSGIHVMALRSYFKPGAAFIASFVVFITIYHLLLFLLVK